MGFLEKYQRKKALASIRRKARNIALHVKRLPKPKKRHKLKGEILHFARHHKKLARIKATKATESFVKRAKKFKQKLHSKKKVLRKRIVRKRKSKKR